MKDGGFAFPRPLPPSFIATSEATARYGGMTLRDHFAGQAMAALLPAQECTDAELAEIAYDIADAMIAASEAEHATDS